jgi:hypothetical protein
MCKEMLVIPVEQGGGPKKNNRKKWTAEEERYKGSLTPKTKKLPSEPGLISPLTTVLCLRAATRAS